MAKHDAASHLLFSQVVVNATVYPSNSAIRRNQRTGRKDRWRVFVCLLNTNISTLQLIFVYEYSFPGIGQHLFSNAFFLFFSFFQKGGSLYARDGDWSMTSFGFVQSDSSLLSIYCEQFTACSLLSQSHRKAAASLFFTVGRNLGRIGI